MKDVIFDEYGARVRVDGKTGMRRVRLIGSVPYLTAWVNMHPGREEPKSPLWVCYGNINHGKALSYHGMIKILKESASKAGVKKRINPHIWRHSRATHMAPKLKELQMDQYFGWVPGSGMPRTYVHLSGRDIDDSLLEVYGMKKKQEEEESMKPKTCQICSRVNEFSAQFCNKCARPLDVKSVMEIEQKRAVDANSVSKMITPEILEQLISQAVEKRIKEIIKAHPNLSKEAAAVAAANAG